MGAAGTGHLPGSLPALRADGQRRRTISAMVSGLEALAELAALREEAFSNLVIGLRGLDQVGNKAYAEWLIEADHTGPLVLDDDAVLEATGRHVQLPGVTVADFREGKIRSYRTYFDDLSLIEQIVGA